MNDAQHGFRHSRSTSTVLDKFADDVNGHLNDKKYVVLLFIDFKKAFDTLEHNLLLKAMSECGISGPTNKWFSEYLHKRTLSTMVDGVRGKEADILYGVPTGSVYGPVGYTMHVNSLPNIVRNCATYMYADDTCIMYAHNNVKYIEQQIQQDLNNLLKWSHDNGILLNIDKTKCMMVQSPYLQKPNLEVSIIGHTYECLHNEQRSCICQNIEFVDRYKYLGLIVDCNFSWKYHIEKVCEKLRAILSKFMHLKHVVNKPTLYLLYHTLVESVIGYGLSTYGRTFKTYLDRIKTLQIRFLKMLVDKKTKTECKGDYEILFHVCKILPVHDKVKYLLALQQYGKTEYKIVRKCTYPTRNLTKSKYVEPTMTNYYGERTRKSLIPKIYNNLFPESQCLSKNVFKQKVKQHLIEHRR